REWGAVERALLAEGLVDLESREDADLTTVREFILPLKLYFVPGGFPQQVRCRLKVDPGDPDSGEPVWPGQVVDAEMLFVAEFNRPHSEVLTGAAYPPGTVGDLALHFIRKAALKCPNLVKVEISCGRRGRASESDPPFRFF